MRHSHSLILAALAGCGSGTASPDARVIDSGGIDAVPGSPTVIATSPADGDTATPIVPTVSVTFSEPMNPATLGVNTGDEECTGSLQLSADGFGSCVPMTGQPTTDDDITFEVVPAEELLGATRYEIRVTTAATDAAGNPLGARFETGPGFTFHSRYTDYVDSTDAFLPEIYPIRSHQDCEVAHVTRDMKLIGDDLRRSGRKAPIWAITQDFEGWGWQRYPTEAETRVMTYLAIIHGATGMTYYTYGGTGKNHGVTHDPQVWAALKRISRQLADLHDVLVQRDPPQKQLIQILSGPQTDGLGYPAVSTLLKEHHGRRYLLAGQFLAWGRASAGQRRRRSRPGASAVR